MSPVAAAPGDDGRRDRPEGAGRGRQGLLLFIGLRLSAFPNPFLLVHSPVPPSPCGNPSIPLIPPLLEPLLLFFGFLTSELICEVLRSWVLSSGQGRSRTPGQEGRAHCHRWDRRPQWIRKNQVMRCGFSKIRENCSVPIGKGVSLL